MNNVLYIFTGEVQYCNPDIFTNEHYTSWFQQLRDQCLPVLINSTDDNVHFLNQVQVKNQDVSEQTTRQKISMTFVINILWMAMNYYLDI